MNEPLISVAVAVKNGQATIRRCVESLLALDWPRVEIIVVDDGSTDATAAELRGFAGKIKVISNAVSQGPSRARNEAAKLARGEYIAFTDGDCIVPADWLRELMECFADHPDAAGAGGSQAVPDDDSDFARDLAGFMSALGFMTDYLHSSRSGIAEVEHNPSCNVMYRRSLYLEEGGFLEGLWPGEDVEFDRRLRVKGHRLYFNPGARVFHYRPRDIRAFRRAMVRYGWAQAFLVRRYGIFRRVQYVPFLCAGSAATACVLSVFYPFVGLWLITAAVLSVPVWFMMKTRDAGRSLRYWRLFFVLMVAWNMGFFKGMMEKKKATA
ncbi:MAG: glycosyltransferase [Deltaproteobacteria bacterium]